MTANAEQLAFDLPFRSAMGAEDFLVSGSNSAAVAAVDSWPAWPQSWLAIIGPAGSGKSHLVEVWRQHAGAGRVAAGEIGEDTIELACGAGGLAVEDIDRGIASERVLFHLMNLAREARTGLLLTSRSALGDIAVALPDLRSRLRATPFVAIAPPDDALLGALLVKLFADRQLEVRPHIIAFLVQRMDRSTEAAIRLVAEIDRRALALKRQVTRELARDVLEGASRA